MMHHLQNKLLIGLLALLPSLTVALPSDRDKPINIEADHAQLDDKLGITQYKGRAILTQGTLRIDGDIITFYYDKNKQLTKVVAQGKMAKYQQVQKPGEAPVKAEALQMEYHAGGQKIHLLGQGFVWQNGSKFSGNRIEYDIARNIVNANANPVTVDNKVERTKGRVHFIIDPNNQQISNKKKPKKQPVVASKPKPKQLPNPPIEPIIENDAQNNSGAAYPSTQTLSRLNIRTGPGKNYDKLATLAAGSELIVLTEQNEWLQVRGISNGQVVIGWVHRNYVSPNQF
jgi:lipopolysaccharide export system protein LptA